MLADHIDDVERCLSHAHMLTAWERHFLACLIEFDRLSPKQEDKLVEIIDKIAKSSRKHRSVRLNE